MNINKSYGPDEIHPVMLKKLFNNVSKPIALILNKSMERGVLPMTGIELMFLQSTKRVQETVQKIIVLLA